MSFDLVQAFDILARTPAVLNTLLRGTNQVWHRANEGPDTWSPFEVVGHLIHGEDTDWVARARIVIEHGETRPFEPFDRFAQADRFKGWPLDRLLDRFAEVRSENLVVVRGWRLTEDQLNLRGQHPALGQVTLRELFATWVTHDLNHIGQIARVMAKVNMKEVGPWREYLPILKPRGSSTPA